MQISLVLSVGTEGVGRRWALLPVIGTAIVLGSTYAFTDHNKVPMSSLVSPSSPVMARNWVQQLALQEGNELVLSAETMYSHPLLKKDHMVKFLLDACPCLSPTI